jgi:hypothetical protein
MSPVDATNRHTPATGEPSAISRAVTGRMMTDVERQLLPTFRKICKAHDARSSAARSRLRRKLSSAEKVLLDVMYAEGRAGVWRALVTLVGSFYHTTGSELFFFRDADHRLYDLDERTFELYLIQLTGETAWVRGVALPRFRAWVRFQAPEVTTHFLAYNAADLALIALNTFDGHMMRRQRGGKWERVVNGSDGILFKTPTEFLASWRPDLTNGGRCEDLNHLCSLGNYAHDGPLSVMDQQQLLRMWLLHLFMPAVNPVHPIPLMENITGSGKSVLGETIGRWLTGPEFEVMDLPSGDAAKAEESVKLALCKRPLVVIDNVDSPAPWLEDFLCRYATGVRMSRRRLYTNAEEVHFTPRAGLIITSRDPHFRREDVARRLLPVRFHGIPPNRRKTETELRADIDRHRERIWGDVLVALAAIQDNWSKIGSTANPSHSLADFAVFGEVATVANGGSASSWRDLMCRLEQTQQRFSTEDDPLLEVLKAQVDQGKGTVPLQPVSKLFTALSGKAQEMKLLWPLKNPAALTRALKNKKHALEQALGAQIVLDSHHQGGTYWVAVSANPGPAARTGSGGNGGQGGDNSDSSPFEEPGVPCEVVLE